MRKIVCDKCGREDLAPLRPERFAVEIKMPSQTFHIDLCERCTMRLKNWATERDPVAA